MYFLLEPIKLSFYRNLVTILILLPFALNKLLKDRNIYLKKWKIITILSILSGGTFNVFMNISLTTSSVISSSLMPAFAPTLIIVFSFLIYRSVITILQSVGVVISFIGFINIIIKGSIINISNLDFVIGDLWMLAAVISWSIYSVLLKIIPQTFDTIVFLFLIFLIGNFFVAPFFIYESILHNSFLINEKNGILLSLYVGIGPALISYLLWIKAIKIIGANNSSLFLNLIPVFSSIISIIFLNKFLEIYHIIGAFLIFTGIYLVTKNYINEKN